MQSSRLNGAKRTRDFPVGDKAQLTANSAENFAKLLITHQTHLRYDLFIVSSGMQILGKTNSEFISR